MAAEGQKKKIGTRNEIHVLEQSEFPVYDGKHEAIRSEEDWNPAQKKRKNSIHSGGGCNHP